MKGADFGVPGLELSSVFHGNHRYQDLSLERYYEMSRVSPAVGGFDHECKLTQYPHVVLPPKETTARFRFPELTAPGPVKLSFLVSARGRDEPRESVAIRAGAAENGLQSFVLTTEPMPVVVVSPGERDQPECDILFETTEDDTEILVFGVEAKALG